jgi:hypothetical protein
MQNKMKSLRDYEEPERLLLLAKLHHALWYDDKMFRVVMNMMDIMEQGLPEAVFYPNSEHNEQETNDVSN